MKHLTGYFPSQFCKSIEEMCYSGVWTELFLRVGQPAIFFAGGREYILTAEGGLCGPGAVAAGSENLYIVSQKDVQYVLEQATNASPMIYQTEIGQGYLTLVGGHRLGFAGEYIPDSNGGRFKYINGIMLRIARERKGCAMKVLPFLVREKGIHNTLIISPPGCGKTTLLRDLSRVLSDGTEEIAGRKIALVDERMELSAMHHGKCQFEVGMRTNVLCGCKKETAFVMAVRSLSPEILIGDEIGFQEESRALLYGIYSGCGVICTTHGSAIEEVKARNSLSRLFDEHIFTRFILLKKEKQIFYGEIYDGEGRILNDGVAIAF